MSYKNNLSTVVYIAVGILLAFGLNLGMGVVLATDLPIVAVESNSMAGQNPDSFYKGDILILQGTSSEDLEIGDIIVFTPDSHQTPIVHRIIAINADGTFQTKGDANARQLSFEKKISPSQIHGKVIAIVPSLGWIKIGFSEYVIPNIVPLTALVIIGFAVYTGMNNTKKAKKKRRMSVRSRQYGFL